MRELTGRQRRAAIALTVVALLFCAFDAVGAPFQGARDGVQGYLGALYRGTDAVLGPPRRWVQALPHAGRDAATTAALRRQVADLQRSTSSRRQDDATRKAVAKLQLQANRGGYRVMPARVVAMGPDGGFDWTVILDAGAGDGVKLDQSVLAGAALVGRVIRVSPTSSTVLLAADPGSGVGVRDQNGGQVGVVTGRGISGSTYSPLDPAATPRVGDELVTGPRNGSSYIAGLAVGRVTTVQRRPDGSWSARVAPSIDPSTLDVVGVILVGGRSAPRPTLSPTGQSANGQARR